MRRPWGNHTWIHYFKLGLRWEGAISIIHRDTYTVSQKNIPDIFDCNLKTNYQILIIFGRRSDLACFTLFCFVEDVPALQLGGVFMRVDFPWLGRVDARTACVKLITEKFEEIDLNDERVRNIKLVLITAQCSRSGVTNPVNFIVNEGEGWSYIWRL